MTKLSPFRYFKTSPKIILAVMMYIRFQLSLRNVEDLLHERGIEISHETVRFWWNRCTRGPTAVRAQRCRIYSKYHWLMKRRRFDGRSIPSARFPIQSVDLIGF